MIPILQFSEPFFFFLAVYIAALICIVTLYGMKSKAGRTLDAALTLIVSLLVMGAIFFLSYRDQLAFPRNPWGKIALCAGLTLIFADLFRRRAAKKHSQTTAWASGLLVGFGLTLYLIAVFSPAELGFLLFLGSFPCLIAIFILGFAIFYSLIEGQDGILARALTAFFCASALCALYALPRLIFLEGGIH